LTVNSLLKQIDDTFDPPRKAQREAVEALDAAKHLHADPLEAVRDKLKSGMGEWSRIEAEVQVYRQRAAQEKAEAEAVAAQKAEAERIRAEADRAKDAGDKRAAKALQAEAKAVEQAPVAVAPVEVESRRPKVGGVSIRENWTADVIDLLLLVRYVAQNPEWIGLLRPDPSGLSRAAKAQREALRIPGVKAYAETVVAAGGR